MGEKFNPLIKNEDMELPYDDSQEAYSMENLEKVAPASKAKLEEIKKQEDEVRGAAARKKLRALFAKDKQKKLPYKD